MSERVKWITHKGVLILVSDYSGLDEDQYLAEMDETVAMLGRAIEKKPRYLLALTDVSNTMTTAKITAKSRACTKLLKGVKAATAIVGLTETKKVIAGIVSPDLRMFENAEQAKNWLVMRAKVSKRP